jgi:NADPH:quinone reductase-like Zn-dependent oxidoreductase
MATSNYGIGTFAVQLAKYFGAEVTAVDSTEKLDMLLSIGADQVIDYTREDFTKSGTPFDVIFDVVGKSSFSRSVKTLNRYAALVAKVDRAEELARHLRPVARKTHAEL